MKMDLNEERLHAFMEKFMNLKLLMRRTRKKESNPRFLLVIIHSIDEGKPVMVSQLSHKMEISNAASTQMIDGLEKIGWVTRTQDEKDRRIMWVDLTKEGKKVLWETFKEAASFMDGMIQYLGIEDFEHLDRIVDKVMEYMLENSFLKP
jgi:DNA-binding MarR family transcriptional regulator